MCNIIKMLVLEDATQRVNFFLEKFGHYYLIITENAFTAIDHLKTTGFDYIFIDNDLGVDNGEGIDVASFLYNNPNNLNNKALIIIHSWNIVATESILSKIPTAMYAPFNSDLFLDLVLTF